MKKLKIHFVGIKGVGMTPLAIIAKEAGFIVTGSDIDQEFITDELLKKAGINIQLGFDKNIIQDQDLVIVTGAHDGFNNIEAIEAKARGLKVISQGEAVGVFMKGEIFGKSFIGVSVAGTHGKTTASSMIATIIKKAGFDPSYVIGAGNIKSLDSSGHLGKGKHFIAEADEYATDPNSDKRPKFLWQSPKIAVFTNIEYDHPDIYSSIDDMRDAYIKFANQMDSKNIIVACGDDPEIKIIRESLGNKFITYGFAKNNDYVLENVRASGDHMFMTVISQGMVISEFMLNVIGEHNALNALASIIVSMELGISIEKIKSGILAFTGSKRRMEFMGEFVSGAKIYDDYAHHPTEIKKTIHALRLKYPNKKIIAIFQPHMYSRTKKLLEEFIRSFSDVDIVILTKIYASLREKVDPEVSSEILANRLSASHKKAIYLEGLSDVVKYLDDNRFRSDTVIVTMGAGDIYKIHSSLNFI